MGQLLLCLSMLVALLCLLASFLDATRDVRWRRLRDGLYWFGGLGGLALTSWLTIEACHWPPGPFRGKWAAIGVSLTAAWVLGTLAVRRTVRRSQRSTGDDATAPTWPPSQPIAILLASLCTGAAIAGVLGYRAQGELETAQQELEARIAASTGAQPELEDAAPLYEEAFEALEDDDVQPELAEAVRDGMTTRLADSDSAADAATGTLDTAELERFLHRHGELLDRVVAAALDPKTDLRLEVRTYRESGQQQSLAVRAVLELLRNAHLLAMARQDSGAALRYTRASLGLARQQLLPRPSCVFDFLLGAATSATAFEQLEATLAMEGWADSDLHGLTIEGEEPFRRLCVAALEGEELVFVRSVLRLHQGLGGEGPRLVLIRGVVQFLHNVLFASQDLEGLRSTLAAYRSSLETSYAAAFEQPTDVQEGLRFHGIMSGFILPTILRAGVEAAQADARLNLARAAIAATRHRLRHGSHPATLEALVPELLARVPSDPFTGEALRMRRVPGGIVIYSVGQNRIDDGGVRGDPDGPPLDICLRLGQRAAAE